MAKQNTKSCEVLTPEFFLDRKQFNIWNCYSEQKSDFNGRLHFHEFYELSVIYEGTSRFMVNGSEFAMGVKSIQLIRPSDYHRQQTGENEHIYYYNLMFSAEFLSPDLMNLLEECPGPLCANAADDEWKDILRLVQTIEREFLQNHGDPMTQIFIRANVENLCVYILKHQQPRQQNHEETLQEPIRRSLNYVQRNYRKEIRLSDAAEAAGLSPSYFSSLFHSTMGITFSLYLTNYRLQIAERYLRTSELSVKQIAAVCGFPAYPHFVTAFKAEYGIPPGAFRKGLTKKS